MTEEWVEAARRGDEAAFEQLVLHYRGMGLAIARERLKDAQLAEDAVQEAFAAVLPNLPQLKQAAAFPGWFRTIVIRQCQRTLRGKPQAGSPFADAERVQDLAPGPEEAFLRKEKERAIRRSVEQLSSRLRLPVELFYYQGYSLQEIAGALDVSLPALKKRLHDARRKLKGTLPVADLASTFRHLYGGGTSMLHVVNGDSLGDLLKQGIVEGDVLVWREIYSVGPVFEGPFGEEEWALRGQELARALGVEPDAYRARCREQEGLLKDLGRYDEAVLWFEHDLFDQSMLAYLLFLLNGRKRGQTKLSLLSIGSFPGIEPFHGLGQLTAEQLGTLSGTWRTIGSGELRLGSELWRAYASPDPRVLADLLEVRREALEASALPFAPAAFQAHLSRLPSLHNGLGSMEEAMLRCIRDGISSPIGLFRRVTDELPLLGMGDLEFFYYLRELAEGHSPLVTCEEIEHAAASGSASSVSNSAAPFGKQRRFSLTSLGRRVLEGTADRVREQGIDRWYGGLHLKGREAVWRYDRTAERPVRTQ